MILISLLSLIIDGIISVLLSNNSIWIPLFSLVSLIVIYPYLKRKESILLYGGIIGLLYDLVYTQTLFLNTTLFCGLALVILLFYKFLPINIFNSFLLMLLLITLFRVVGYLVVVIIGNLSFSWNELFVSIYSSILSNVIYLILFSFLLRIVMNKRKEKKRSLSGYKK